MDIRQRYVILSAELNYITSEENLKRSRLLLDMVKSLELDFHTASGFYKGEKERSLFINIKNNSDLEAIKNIVFKQFKQESIFYSDSNGNCTLEYSDGISDNVGKMNIISPKYIGQLNNYTIVNGKILTTEKVV